MAVTLKDRLGQRSYLAAVAALILVAVGIIVIHRWQTEVTPDNYAYHLAGQVGDIKNYAQQLEEALNKPEAHPVESYRTYLAILAKMEDGCKKVLNISDRSQKLDIDATGRDHIQQSADLCGDLTPLLQYQQSRYRAAGPLLAAGSGLRLGERWIPFLAARRVKAISAAGARTTERLDSLPPDPDLDFGTTASLSAAAQTMADESDKIRQEKASSEKLQPLLALLQQQQQAALAARVQYWRSSVNLDALVAALNSQLSNYCQRLGGSSHPDHCS